MSTEDAKLVRGCLRNDNQAVRQSGGAPSGRGVRPLLPAAAPPPGRGGRDAGGVLPHLPQPARLGRDAAVAAVDHGHHGQPLPHLADAAGGRPEPVDYLQDTAAGPPADDSRSWSARFTTPWPICVRSTARSSCYSTSRAGRTRKSPRRGPAGRHREDVAAPRPDGDFWTACGSEAWFRRRRRCGAGRRSETDMTCPECQDRLQRWLDGRTPGAADAGAGPALCPSCADWAPAALRLDRGLRLRTPPVPPPQLAFRILGRLSAVAPRPPPGAALVGRRRGRRPAAARLLARLSRRRPVARPGADGSGAGAATPAPGPRASEAHATLANRSRRPAPRSPR